MEFKHIQKCDAGITEIFIKLENLSIFIKYQSNWVHEGLIELLYTGTIEHYVPHTYLLFKLFTK